MTPQPKPNLDELEVLAKAATQGVLGVERRDDDCGDINYIVHGSSGDFAWCRDELDPRARHNAAYIAALSPEVVLSLIAAARELENRRWIPGSPTENGRYWVVMWLLQPGRWEVRAVEIGPAVLVPGGRQLLKMSNGAAFAYEPNRYAIRWHMPAHDPAPPVDLASLPPLKEPTNGR